VLLRNDLELGDLWRLRDGEHSRPAQLAPHPTRFKTNVDGGIKNTPCSDRVRTADFKNMGIHSMGVRRKLLGASRRLRSLYLRPAPGGFAEWLVRECSPPGLINPAQPRPPRGHTKTPQQQTVQTVPMTLGPN
jgi:hypothetical protein